jgi:TPR repeat protein
MTASSPDPEMLTRDSAPNGAATPPQPWRIDGIAQRHQDLALQGATRAGLPLAEWLGAAIERAAHPTGAASSPLRAAGLRGLALAAIAGAAIGGGAAWLGLAGGANPVPSASYPQTGTPQVQGPPPTAIVAAPSPAGPPSAGPSSAGPSSAGPTPASRSVAPSAPADPLEALRRAAQGGDAEAQFELGARHTAGDGVALDWVQAASWFRKAADGGMGRAQHNLGVLYERGRGVEADQREAVRWYERAAEQGFAASQYNLGAAYARGIDGVPDLPQAVVWLERAAEQLPQGNVALAEIYESDTAPGGRDLARARAHYLLALAGGDARAAARLETLTAEVVMRETLRDIQQALIRLRLYAGEADGVAGQRTIAAIRRFQREQRIPEDGQPSQALLARLRVVTPER